MKKKKRKEIPDKFKNFNVEFFCKESIRSEILSDPIEFAFFIFYFKKKKLKKIFKLMIIIQDNINVCNFLFFSNPIPRFLTPFPILFPERFKISKVLLLSRASDKNDIPSRPMKFPIKYMFYFLSFDFL